MPRLLCALWITTAAAFTLTACDELLDPPENDPVAVLEIADGDEQSALQGSAVEVPPTVVVRDGAGEAVVGETVSFAVASGEATITGGSTVTNDQGRASVGSWTLDSEGAHTLAASVEGVDPVTFTATAIGACEYAHPYVLGDTVEDVLTESDCIDDAGRYVRYYSLDAASQASVLIELGFADATPLVRVLDAEGRTVAGQYASDPGWSRAVLPAGSYRIAVHAVDAGVTGTFALTASEAEHSGAGCGAVHNVFLAPGATHAGQIAAEDCVDEVGDPENRFVTYAVWMEEGETYHTDMETNRRAELSLWGGSGLMAFDASSEAGIRSLRFTAPQSGWHTIHPIGRPGTAYHVSFAAADAVDGCDWVQPYVVGTTAGGFLGPQSCLDNGDRYHELYRFQATGQVSLALEMWSESVDPFIGLRDANGRFVITQYVDSPGFTRAILPAGEYTLLPRAVEPGQTGVYFTRAAPAAHDGDGCDVSDNIFVVPGVSDSGRLAADDCLDGDTEAGDRFDTYVVGLQAGETLEVQLDLDGGGLLSIWGPDGGGEHGLRELVQREGAGTLTLGHSAESDGWFTVHPIGPVGRSYEIQFLPLSGAALARSRSPVAAAPLARTAELAASRPR